MPVLEEKLREEEMGLTEAELVEDEAEVKKAEGEQELIQDAFGKGLDHDELLRYDVMAHHIKAAISGLQLADAEHKVALQWDPLQKEQHTTAQRGLETIKAQVIAPVLAHKTTEARQELEAKATDLLAAQTENPTKTRAAIQEEFCGEISKQVTGAEFHPVAVEVYERLIDPVAKDPEPEVPVQEEQKDQAEEQIEEKEEEKQSA